VPLEAKLILPGFALAWTASSASVFTGNCGSDITRKATDDVCVTGAKSRAMSKERFFMNTGLTLRLPAVPNRIV
jgi:hypothetical protein